MQDSGPPRPSSRNEHLYCQAMKFVPPNPVQFDQFRKFLLRDARETFGPDADDARVVDRFTSVYQQYPRYGRLSDLHGKALLLGDRYFRLAELANLFLAATQFGHDRFGIMGDASAHDLVALQEIEMSKSEFDALLDALAAAVHEIDPQLVIEYDWWEHFSRGPTVAAVPPRATRFRPAAAEVVLVRDLAVTKVALVRTPVGFALDIQGDRTPISEAEAEVFVNTTDKRLLDWVLGPEVDRTANLGDLVSTGLRTDLEYVFMDQSTFRNALRALEDDVLIPSRLFDLSTMAHYLVFADAIAVPSTCTVPEALQGIVVRSGVDEARLSPAMAALARPHGFDPADGGEVDGLKQIELSWGAFLGVEVELDYRHVDSATDSPGSWEYVPGGSDWSPGPAELIVAGTGTRQVSAAASIHTLRYILNERRAALMGVPYAASALRYPVQAVQLRNALHFCTVIDQLLRPAIPTPHEGLGALVHPMRLPDALGIACAEARDRSDILTGVLDLRAAMTSFREALRESREVGETGTDIIRRLRRPLAGMVFARTADAAIARVSSVATATGADLGTALVVAKLAEPLNLAERAVKLLDLIRRPHIRVLQRFAQRSADGATTDDIMRLWDTRSPLTRKWFSTVIQLSDLSPFESAKLTRF
ncbi:hypothetical protein GCM10028790_20090 [Micromonospora taraxaci]